MTSQRHRSESPRESPRDFLGDFQKSPIYTEIYWVVLRYTHLCRVYLSIYHWTSPPSLLLCDSFCAMAQLSISWVYLFGRISMLCDNCSYTEYGPVILSYTEFSRWSAFQGKFGPGKLSYAMRQFELYPHDRVFPCFTSFSLESWPPGHLGITGAILTNLGCVATVL